VSLTPDLSLSLISLPPTNPTSTMKGSVYLWDFPKGRLLQ
jgi:hypothetical protein